MLGLFCFAHNCFANHINGDDKESKSNAGQPAGHTQALNAKHFATECNEYKLQRKNGKHDQNIELEINNKENDMIFSITDFAGGLPKEVQDKLFKEMVTTKGKNGTGLGLYMSYSNIKAHFGGDITYKTEIGKGTTFNIIIPIKK